MISTWAEKQKEAFKTALLGGSLKDLVAQFGGTGDLREPLTPKERAKRKRRKQIAKSSRLRNRR